MPQYENGCQIKNEILAFYNSLAADPNHRYRSWEHCYGYFRQHASFRTKADYDIASLHLAFYLASWGMYRGSSDLLWKDYKIHKLAILKLLEPKYTSLWRLNLGDSNYDGVFAELIVSLSEELKQIYREQITTVNGKKKNHQPSEILITKILLGTVGCTPACDRFFIIGFRHKLQYSTFGRTFLCRVFQFYREHAAEFLETQQAISQSGRFDYPVMKLIDMYFSNLGVKLHPESKHSESVNEA
jgi:hypothetical protein